MMRNIYTTTLLLAALLFSNFLGAQSCIPDTTLPDSVIVSPLPYQADFPERGLVDTACVGSYFETVLQVNVPNTVTLSGFELMLDAVVVNQTLPAPIENLPPGFDYVCNPPSCDFPADSTGCIVVYCKAVAGSEGIYDLKINVIAETSFSDVPLKLPDPLIAPGNYFLTVKPAGGANCFSAVVDYGESGFQVKLAPNPTRGLTTLVAEITTAGRYTLRVSDLLGRQVMQRSVPLTLGTNQIEIDATGLPVGMYLYSLDNGVIGSAGRLIVQQ